MIAGEKESSYDCQTPNNRDINQENSSTHAFVKQSQYQEEENTNVPDIWIAFIITLILLTRAYNRRSVHNII